jgi:hypothetical protein
MIGLMLEVCPSFRPSWEEFLDYWADDKDPPLYLALADLARHLISMLAKNKTSSFPRIFEVVERWHVEGDHYVKEAATVGLLEDLQNTNLHETTQPEDFRPFLLPESERWWDKLYGFWERGELLSDD